MDFIRVDAKNPKRTIEPPMKCKTSYMQPAQKRKGRKLARLPNITERGTIGSGVSIYRKMIEDESAPGTLRLLIRSSM